MVLVINITRVLLKTIDGVLCEPIDDMVADVPSDCVGAIIEKMGKRAGELKGMTPFGENRMRIQFSVPSRGLFGYKSEFLTDTKGEGVLTSVFDKYDTYRGDIERRSCGSLVAYETGESITYGLFNAQGRGPLFIGPGVKVYEGMVVGQNPKGGDIVVNVCKAKQLTNMRASGSDDALRLVPHVTMSLEQAIEYISDDEYLEVTPLSFRIRKTILDAEMRAKAEARKKKQNA